MVGAIVDKFYDKVLFDDRLNHFFESTDMDRLGSHQKLFIMYIFGGSGSYIGKQPREAHKHLVKNMGLSDRHFDAMMENLKFSMNDLQIPVELVDEALDIVENLRFSVLNK